MRKLCIISASLSIAVFASYYFLPFAVLLPVGLLCAGAAAVLLFLCRNIGSHRVIYKLCLSHFFILHSFYLWGLTIVSPLQVLL